MLYDCIMVVRLKNTGLGSDVYVCFVTGVWCALSAGSVAHAPEHIKCLVSIRTGYVSARLYIYIVVHIHCGDIIKLSSAVQARNDELFYH